MRFPTALPIDPHLESLCTAVERAPVTLIQAPPGTGKTVHLPLALLRLGRVWVLEPRRVAARLAAEFAASEARGIPEISASVGYHFRNENRTDAKTRLTYLTEGMLLRLAQRNPHLSDVKVVILDEFHERHASTDSAWAYLRHLQGTTRPDLKIVILSATLDLPTLTAQIPELRPQIVTTSAHSLEILHRDDLNLTEAIVETHQILQKNKTPGSILVFLAGRRDIEDARALLQRAPLPVEILHGSLDTQEQARVVAPGREARIILTTNLAESSLTVDGVRAVIDAGNYRQAHAQPWTGVPELRTRRITRASAIQRAGRAARQGPGIAMRLYSAAEFSTFLPFETPEILRADLSPFLLELLALGIPQPSRLPWLDPPPQGTWSAATRVLENLDFIQASPAGFELTEEGQEARKLPAPPRIARLALDSRGILDAMERKQIEDLAIGLATEQLLNGDCTFLKLPPTRAIADERRRLLSDSATNHPSRSSNSALLHAFGDHVAHLSRREERGSVYLTASGSELWLPHSAGNSATPEWLVAISVLDSQKELASGRRSLARMRSYLPLQEEQLIEAPPRFWTTERSWKWEAEKQTFVQLERSRFGQIILSESRRFPCASPELGERLLERYIALKHAHDSSREQLESVWVRLKLAGLLGADPLPPWQGGLQALFAPLAATWDSLKDAPDPCDLKSDLAETVAAHLSDSGALQKLRKLAPQALTLPKRRASILYRLNEAPRCESKLQDFLGFKETPRVGHPPMQITLVLLAPNFRPVQITQDLAGFWRNTYPALRKELMRRYPRHAWPEDPLALP